jgi:hypothetical protein
MSDGNGRDAAGAVPVEEMAAIDSEVRHLRTRVAEERLDVRARFNRIDDQLEKMTTSIGTLHVEIAGGRSSARLAVILLSVVVTVGIAVTPWIIRSVVRDEMERRPAAAEARSS